MFAIFKREFTAYFTSPIGYVFAAACILISGLVFYLFTLGQGSTDLTPVFHFMYFVLMIFVPVLTMRLMSEEKRQKADQLLLTAPVSLTGLVAGKFLSAYAVFLLGVFILPVYGIVLSFFATISWITLWGNFVGILLLGGVYVAMGLFVSSLTENQMIAAVGSMFLNLVIFLMNTLATVIPVRVISNTLRSISIFNRYVDFTLGMFVAANILFFITVMAIFLFLTVRVLERRRWA
ncbi:MAG: ABC transporter permease [Oscillospiraceae bacterium]|jgi:ABC-2 type transport system permease protein|nr:ABC transporter permease [Oscillospiraceae bacterium]